MASGDSAANFTQFSLPPNGEPPRMEGTLHKWTNFASGYRSRWFILQNGILSYYKSEDDVENLSRGSINLRATRIEFNAKDRQYFSIIGQHMSARYHLKASSVSDANRWLFALIQSKQWLDDQNPLQKEEGCQSQSHGSPMRQSVLPAKEGSIHAPSEYGCTSLMSERVVAGQDVLAETIQAAQTLAHQQETLIDEAFAAETRDGHAATVEQDLRRTNVQLRQKLEEIQRANDEREQYWRLKETDIKNRETVLSQSLASYAEENMQLERALNRKGKSQRQRTGSKTAEDDEKLEQHPSPDKGSTSSTSENRTRGQEGETSDEEDMFFDAETFVMAEERQQDEAAPPAPNRATTMDISLEGGAYTRRSFQGYPLKGNFRQTFPLTNDNKPEISLWSILKSAIGKDLSRISIPVYFNEPTSMLQRMAEDIEYDQLLDLAAQQRHSTERILWVAAFAMSNYSSTVGRVAKPFNPLLGETYEYVRPDKGYRYVSEQVSHHPPISACYCESPHYNFYTEVNVKSKFWGKSFELYPLGVNHVELKVSRQYLEQGVPQESVRSPRENANAFLEHYTWRKVTTVVNNLIVGRPWIDNYGDMVITNHRTGDTCVLTFKARGWRGQDEYVIEGHVLDAQGNKMWEVGGRWDQRLVARRPDTKGRVVDEPIDDDAALAESADHSQHNPTMRSPSSLSQGSSKKPKKHVLLLWRRAPMPNPPVPFNLTPFAVTLNELPDGLRPLLPPTDSRLRPDQRAMEEGKYDLADQEKYRLEEKQRAKRRDREQDSEASEWAPRWFVREECEQDSGEPYWRFTGEYWKERDRCAQELAAKRRGSEVHWRNVEDIF